MTGSRPVESAAQSRWIGYGGFALVCAVTLAAYWPSFSASFQFDDNNHIVDNAAIHAGDVGEFIRFGRTRIIPFTTLAANYWVAGLEPFGFHVINFLVHLLAILALYGLILALCATPRLRNTPAAEHRFALATAAALVFACHPIQTQAVTYIVQRISAMAAMFYLTAVFCYVRARNAELGLQTGRAGKWYVAAGSAALAALLSKENAASMPVALLLTEWIFYPGRMPRKALRRIGAVGALVALIPLSWWLLPWAFASPPAVEQAVGATETAPPARSLSWSIRAMIFRAEGSGRVSAIQYLLTQCIVVPRYLRMAIAPYGLNVDHDVRVVRELSVSVLAGAALLLALAGFGIYANKHWPLVAFGILWIFVALSVESSVLPIRDPMVEHRMYLAMPGIALVAAVGFLWLQARIPAVAYIAGIACVTSLVVMTFMRNQVWQTPISLWGDSVEKAPDKARPHVNLATALYQKDQIDQAIAHFCWARRLDPSNTQVQANLSALAEQQMEKEMAAGKMVFLGGRVGEDGNLELEPRDPCEGR